METFGATSKTIACTLTPADLEETQSAWDKLLRLSLVSRQEIPGGIRLVMHPGSGDALRALIDVERECCTWITFAIDGSSVEMTALGAAAATIRDMWRMPASQTAV